MERFTGRVDASNKYKKVEFGIKRFSCRQRTFIYPKVNFMEVPFMHQAYLCSTPIYNEDGTYASGYRENNGYNPILEAEVNDYYARTVRAMGTAK